MAKLLGHFQQVPESRWITRVLQYYKMTEICMPSYIWGLRAEDIDMQGPICSHLEPQVLFPNSNQ